MNLEEIEAKADDLASQLIDPDLGRQQHEHAALRLEGLAHAAHIKATVAYRKEQALPDLAMPGLTASEQCGYIWIWNNSNGAHEEECTLPHGHGSAHHNARTDAMCADPLVAPKLAEPTKPVADRLHELVSYFTAEADSAEANAERYREDAGNPARKHPEDYEAGVYRDAATKLQEILQEGGI